MSAPLRLQDRKDYRCVADTENAQEVFRAVLSAGLGDLAGVISVHEFGVFAAAYLRRQLHLPGNSDSRGVLFFRDKYLQKNRLPPDVRRARARYASRATPYAELAGELGKQFVVKPAIGAGSLRTEVVRSAEEYHRALEPFPGESDVDVVAESFVDAPEIYMDGIWQGGELHWRSLTRYHNSPLSAVHGRVLAAHLLDERLHPDLFEQTEDLTKRVLKTLEAPDCVFHMEAYVEHDGLTFGECAIRLPGALSPQLVRLTHGVDLFDAEISLALGQSASLPPAVRPPERFHGYLLLRRPDHGSLTREDFARAFTFDKLTYSSSPDTPPGPYGRVGEAIVSDPDERRLSRTIAEIVRFNETGGK
ncbi:ATP-grasp domain-containing protein [Streptomyces sp. NPDC002540]